MAIIFQSILKYKQKEDVNVKMWIGISLCLLLAGCSAGISERSLSISGPNPTASISNSSNSEVEDAITYQDLVIILGKDILSWDSDDYISILNAPRSILYEVGNVEDRWAMDDKYVGMGITQVVFRQRFYTYPFPYMYPLSSAKIGFHRYLSSPEAGQDQSLFLLIHLAETTVQDIYDKYGETTINEYLYEDTRPAGGTGYYVYDLFYHKDKLIYIFDLTHYGAPLSLEEQQQLPVTSMYILLEDNPLINKEGNRLFPDFPE